MLKVIHLQKMLGYIFKRRNFTLLLIILAASPFLIVPCPAADNSIGSKTNLEAVTLQLKWKHQFQFAGYYAALEKGFYREAGLDVTILEIHGEEESIDKVTGGQADFGIAMSDLILRRAQGQPVVALAAIFQHSPLALLASKTNGIDNIHDLKGKKIGMEAHSAELVAYLENEGISLEEIELMPHGYDVSNLLSGTTDAISAYSTDEPFMLEEEGLDYRIFTPRSAGIDFYGDTLFTSETQIEEHPERVASFVAASLQGWHYALENSEEIIDLIFSKYSQRHSRAHLLFEAEQTKRLIMTEVVPLGYMYSGRWNHIIRTYENLGMIDEDFSLDGFIYSEDSTIELKRFKKIYWRLIAICLVLGSGTLLLILINRKLSIAIKERKRAEKQLQQSEGQKRAILDGISTNLALVDKNLHILWVNKASAQSLGKTPEEMIGQKCHKLWADSNTACEGCPSLLAWKTGKSQHATMHTPDGKIWDEHGEPVFNQDGEMIGVIEIAQDITEQRIAEEALRESETRYRALFDFSPIQTIIVDRSGRITMFNFAKQRSSGRIPVIGDKMYIDYASRHHTDMRRELLDSIETGRKKAFSDLKYNEKYLNIQIAPFAEGAIIISEDVTDRKQMQDLLEQVRKMEVVGTLSGGIAHEFNNLLGIILGNAELAMDDIPKHNPTHEFLLEVKRASIRGKEIVRQLLSFSHRAETEKVTIDITELISESTPYLRTSIPTSISFEQRISDDIIPVKADKSQIQQALINLCHNAVQSMEETGGTLTITVGRQRISEPRVFAGQRLEPGEYAELIIADTGQGVSENIIANIFDPFFTTKEVNKGSGMGLAVVYGIVKGHNGYIEIASTLNEGTRVFCYFPIADEEHIEG